MLGLELGLARGGPVAASAGTAPATAPKIAPTSASMPAPVADEIASGSLPGWLVPPGVELELDVLGRKQVALREHDELGQPLEAGAVGRELAADDRVRRIGIGAGAELEQMDQHPAALDVGEELVSEAGALGGALDQAGDVGEDELALAVVDRAEDRAPAS